MKTLTLAAAAVLFASPALAQTAAPAAPQLNVEIPELERVTADPTCGGKTALVEQRVFCVTTTQAGIGAVVDAYSAAFSTQGWLPAGGSENLIIYVKRKPEGGCDGFQMLAFADDTRVAAPAWLAFAPIPGDVCAAQPAAPAAPAQ
jgi:hypothetical protein